MSSRLSKHELKMSTTAEDLPMAEFGQLQWVKRPLSSLSALACSKEVPSSIPDTNSDDDAPSLWWPSLLFNEHEDFQVFFADEFDKSNIENKDASETMGLIMSRMLQNMRQQRSFMIARLLGRSIRDYVEIVEVPTEDQTGEQKVKNDNLDFLVEPHQATEFVSFTHMPQEVYLRQMEPEAFIVSSNNNLTDDDSSTSDDPITIIDDDLYMNYMLALDLASTKRMFGPQAPHDTLRSEFLEKGRANLAKLPPSVQKSSETAYVSSLFDADAPVIPTEGVEALEKPEQDNDEDKSEEDSSENETEDKEMLEENIHSNEAIGGEGTKSALSFEQEKKTQAEIADTVQPEPQAQAQETAYEANVTEEISGNTSPPTKSIATKVDVACDEELINKKGNEGDDNTDMNDASSLSATVISQSSDGPETSDIGNSPSHGSLTLASTNLSTRDKTKGGDETTKMNLPQAQNESEKDVSKTQPAASSPTTCQMKSPFKKRNGGRARKAILSNSPSKEDVTRSRSVVNSPTTSQNNSPPRSPRRTNRRVLPKSPKNNAALPEESSEEDIARPQCLANSPTVSSVTSSPKRTNRRVLPKTPKSKVVLTEKPGEKKDTGTKPLENNSHTPLVNTSPPKETKRLLNRREKIDLQDESSKEDGVRTLSFNSPARVPMGSPPPKKIKRHISKKKSDLPKVNDIERDQASRVTTRSASTSTSTSQIDGCLEPLKKAVDSSEKTKAQDSTKSRNGVVDKTHLPPFSPVTRAVSVQVSPSQQNTIGVDDNGIKSDDSFDEVCSKLQRIGWTIDHFDSTYFSPSVGFKDVKSNPHWRGKKFFLAKADFLVFLRATFDWTEKKRETPTRKRGRGISNAVTPISSCRPKRTRRSPSFSGESYISNQKPKQFDFGSTDEEEFYNFPNLMRKLKDLGWQYAAARTSSWHYVLPNCRKQSQGGEHLVDFFFEESEVIQYCISQNYYERRKEVGLDDKN